MGRCCSLSPPGGGTWPVFLTTTYAPAAPPDGGFGWAVAVACFWLYFICVGAQYLIGILYRSLLTDVDFTIGWSRADLAFIVSLETSFFLCGMLLAGLIQQRAGTRVVVWLGMALFIGGFVASALATSPAALFLTYGVLTGTGCALPTAAGIVLVSRYFSARRVTATGIVVCGSGFGALVLGPIVESICATMGWRAACYFLAAIAAVILPLASIVLVPIHVPRAYAGKLSAAAGAGAAAASMPPPGIISAGAVEVPPTPFLPPPPSPSRPPSRQESARSARSERAASAAAINTPILSAAAMSASDVASAVVDGDALILDEPNEEEEEEEEAAAAVVSTASASISGSSAVPAPAAVTAVAAAATGAALAPPLPAIADEPPSEVRMAKAESIRLSESAIRRLPSLAGASARDILADRGFQHWLVFIAIYGACWFVIFSQFFSFTLEAGTLPRDASILVAVQGAANTVGRLGLALAVDRFAIPKVAMLQTCVFLMGVATCLLVPLGRSYAYQTLFMMATGILGGSVVSMQAPISVELVGLASLPLAQGLFHLAQAPFVLVAPPVASALRSATGNYDAVWLLTGAFIILSAFVCSGSYPGGWAGWAAALRATAAASAGGRRWAAMREGGA